MRSGIKRCGIFRTILTIALVLSLAFSQPVGEIGASYEDSENAIIYIEDIKYFLADDYASAKADIESEGYIPVLENLNAGTNKTGTFIGYKTTKDRRKAIRKLGLLAMDKGYEIMDYKKLEEKYKQSNYAAADTLCTAAAEFVYNYNMGSPKAIEACEGMNLAYVPESSNMGLGDYILSMGDDQDREFFRKLITSASSGTVSAVISFLSAGLVPYNNEEDEDGNLITKNWAEKAIENPLWEVVEDDTMTEEERSALDQNYQDSARTLFEKLQEFATAFETAEGKYDPGRINELYNQGEDMAETIENTDHVEEEDASIMYVSTYNRLNEYMISGDMPLGEWLVNIGKMTSEEVDLTQLYPLVDSFTDAEREIIGLGGFLSIVGCLEENKKTKFFEDTLNETRKNLDDLLNDDTFSIWEGANDDRYTKVYAYTSDALRQNAAGKLVEELENTKNKVYDTVEEIMQWYGLVSCSLLVVQFLIGSYGLPLLFTAVGGLAVKIGLPLIGSVLTSAAASITALAGAVSTIFSWIITLDLLLLAFTIGWYIGKALASLINYLKEKYSDKEYTTIPDVVIDAVELSGGTANVKYDLVKSTNEAFSADLNGYEAFRGWVCLYTTTDTRVGSPLVVPQKGEPFKVVYGDPAAQEGRDPLCFFGEVSAGNCNTGMYKDEYNGIYVSYTTEDSLGLDPEKGYTSQNNGIDDTASDSDAKTSSVPSGKIQYYSDIVVSSATTAEKAKAKLTKRGFNVLDRNLSPDVREKAEDAVIGSDNQYTYIGYKVTTNVDNAIRDIRVATFEHGSSLNFGTVNYACAGTLGWTADNVQEDKDYPADLDGLYYSKHEKSGTPIPVGNIHIVTSHSQAKEGWVPVTTFGGLPYNFNTTRSKFVPSALYLVNYVSHNYTLYVTEEDHTWDETDVYVYYEPTETFTSGKKYLSGIYFTFGADAVSTAAQIGEVEADFSDLVAKMNFLPNSKLFSNVNLAQSYNYDGYRRDSDQKYLHIGYLWSYNPYRAIYDVQAYQGTLYKPELPYSIPKTTKYSKKNLGDPEEQPSYAAASVIIQRALWYEGEMDNFEGVGRAIVQENAYMSSNGIMGNFEDFLEESYTTELRGDYDYGCTKMPLLPTGIYMSGYMSDKEPLTLDDIVITQHKHDAQILNGKIAVDLSGETTLGGTSANGDFSSIQDMKRPFSTQAFNISYPDWTYDGNDNAAGPSCYIYKRNAAVKKKYISRVFVGSFSRDESGYTKSSELEEVDKVVDHQALLIANSQASDEVIPVNVSIEQDDAWYRAKDSHGKSLNEPDHDKKSPAAYISVSRTDKADEAITGMVLYKTDKKAVPEEMKVDSITYYCASNDKPITESNGTKYFLYYTYNDGATPGKPITEITAGDELFVSGQSTVLTVDGPDGKTAGSESKPYGNPNQYTYIHAEYEHDANMYYNKIYIGADLFRKRALAKLLEQDCTEFIDMNLNKNAGGQYVYIGYKGFTLDEEKIRMKKTEDAKQAEKETQLQEAIYDIVCTVDKPYQPDGLVTEQNQIYYKPVGNVNLNAGTNGPEIYMYYTTIYNAKKYNKNQGKDSRKIHSSMPNDYFKEPITRIAFTECDRVPYLNGEASSGLDNILPWERVLYDDFRTAAELNDGAVWFDDDYNSCDNRIYMYLQRENGHVKSAGEITGGHTSDSTIYGQMWLYQ